MDFARASRTVVSTAWAVFGNRPPDRSKDKRDPFEVVQRFGGLHPGEEVYAEEVTDLSQWLRGRLDREGEEGKAGDPSDNNRSSAPQFGRCSSRAPIQTMTKWLRRSRIGCNHRRSNVACFSRETPSSPVKLSLLYRGARPISPRSPHC
jgi:hypothetical protein